MLKIKTEVAGLHLWDVRIKHTDSDEITDLFITTKRESWAEAGKKIEKFLKQNKKQYPGRYMTSLKYRGTLDA